MIRFASDKVAKLPRAVLWLVAILSVLIGSVSASLTANAAVPVPSIRATAYPDTGIASISGSGYTPNGEVHVWVYRNHQQAAYAVTRATSSGSLVWSGTMAGYATCHDEFDVQAYNVGTNQLTANPFASLGCAANPSVQLHASYTNNPDPALIQVTGSRFYSGATVGLYVYRNHTFVKYIQTTATSTGAISATDYVPGQTYCNAWLDVVAYDYTTHQFSNDADAGNWCIF